MEENPETPFHWLRAFLQQTLLFSVHLYHSADVVGEAHWLK